MRDKGIDPHSQTGTQSRVKPVAFSRNSGSPRDQRDSYQLRNRSPFRGYVSRSPFPNRSRRDPTPPRSRDSRDSTPEPVSIEEIEEDERKDPKIERRPAKEKSSSKHEDQTVYTGVLTTRRPTIHASRLRKFC